MHSRVHIKRQDDDVSRLEAEVHDLKQRLLRMEKFRSGPFEFAKMAILFGVLLFLYVSLQHSYLPTPPPPPLPPPPPPLPTTVPPTAAAVAAASRPLSLDTFGAIGPADTGALVRWPTTKTKDGEWKLRPLDERVRMLEVKTAGRMNWMRDYRLSVNIEEECKNRIQISEHFLCLDHYDIRKQKCIVYDMGIRREPFFGKELAIKYGCEVHAFDPSPVSAKDKSWIKEHGLDKVKNWHFHPYGAGGTDGMLKLYEYNWGQVSPIIFPRYVRPPCSNATLDKDNKFLPKCERVVPEYTSFDLPVKTLPTIMKELGHDQITILKLDVEGSEYPFLEDAIDRFGCLPVNQLSVEWHHYNFDLRYGGGSSPEQHSIIAPLQACGFKLYQRDYGDGGFPDDAKFFYESQQILRYTTTSHMMVPVKNTGPKLGPYHD